MKQLLYLIPTIFLFFALEGKAGTTSEIQHLLNYVSETTCQYERNGDFYNGVEARKHIERKYKYFLKDIKTAEDFIRLSATQSTMSKKKYEIHCAGHKTIKSSAWLLNELAIYRLSTKGADI